MPECMMTLQESMAHPDRRAVFAVARRESRVAMECFSTINYVLNRLSDGADAQSAFADVVEGLKRFQALIGEGVEGNNDR